jgi:hypothetical protein
MARRVKASCLPSLHAELTRWSNIIFGRSCNHYVLRSPAAAKFSPVPDFIVFAFSLMVLANPFVACGQ